LRSDGPSDRLALSCATVALLGLATPGQSLATGGGKTAAQQLIEAYTPRLMLREQQDPPCDIDGEQYEATTVGTVLGNPAVKLTESNEDRDETTLKRAPTAGGIAGLGEEVPPQPARRPAGDTCVYARDFQLKREGKAPAVAFAHIARETGRTGLAVHKGLELDGEQTDLGRDQTNQGGDHDAAELDHRALHPFDSALHPLDGALHRIEPGVHFATELAVVGIDPGKAVLHAAFEHVEAPVHRVEALVGVCGEVIEPLVGPAFPHRLHDATLADNTLRVTTQMQNICNTPEASDG